MLQHVYRPREPVRESQERLRYEILAWVLQQVGEDCTKELTVSTLADQLNVPREAIYAATEYLARNEYLEYRGAGPLVCITPKGLEYLSAHARRRRSVRDRDD